MKTSKQLKSPAIMKHVLFLLDLCEKFLQTKTFYPALPFMKGQNFFFLKKVFIRPKLFTLPFPFTLPLLTAMSLQPKLKKGVLDPTLATGQPAGQCYKPDRSPPAWGDLLAAEQSVKRNDVENTKYGNSYLNGGKNKLFKAMGKTPTQLGKEKRVVSSAQAQVKCDR